MKISINKIDAFAKCLNNYITLEELIKILKDNKPQDPYNNLKKYFYEIITYANNYFYIQKKFHFINKLLLPQQIITEYLKLVPNDISTNIYWTKKMRVNDYTLSLNYKVSKWDSQQGIVYEDLFFWDQEPNYKELLDSYKWRLIFALFQKSKQVREFHYHIFIFSSYGLNNIMKLRKFKEIKFYPYLFLMEDVSSILKKFLQFLDYL